MGLISDLKPLNLKEEKNKFFNDSSYNPQFKYKKEFSKEELTKYGLPKESFFNFSRNMLEKFGSKSNQKVNPISKDEVITLLNNLFIELQIPPLEIVFDNESLSQLILYDENITIKEPITFSREVFISKIDHEIQTHYIRRLNDQKQPWHNDEDREMKLRLTEEGLANLHTFLHRNDKVMRKSYLNYFASFFAWTHSFRETYNELVNLGYSPEFAWSVTLKRKRGLNDTSQHGGFTKGIVYLEGAVKVWKWLTSGNDPKELYIGKIGINEVENFSKKSLNDNLIYPTFLKDTKQYMHLIHEIGNVNEFEKLV